MAEIVEYGLDESLDEPQGNNSSITTHALALYSEEVFLLDHVLAESLDTTTQMKNFFSQLMFSEEIAQSHGFDYNQVKSLYEGLKQREVMLNELIEQNNYLIQDARDNQ